MSNLVPQFPNTTAILDNIREGIQRPIIINVKVQGTPCPVCELDSVTNTSTDSFCSYCSGVFWLNTISGYTISGHIKWIRADQPIYTAGGVIDQGDCIVTVKYSALALTNIQNSNSFVVDNRDLYIKHYVTKGVPDINRIRIVLKEDSD